MTQSGVSDNGKSRTHRSILGLRASALAETLLFLAIALLVDAGLGAGNRFSEVSPHPFWIIVLLVSTYYGTNEGLATAALCAVAALVGNIPEQGFNEERTAWLLRVTADPVLWIVAALLLGEIRSGYRHRHETLKEELENAQRRVTTITNAYEALAEAKRTLELRIAAQIQTVQSVYRASRAIESQEAGEVLAGIPELVRSIMAPNTFSVFLLKESSLTATMCEGWSPGDNLVREFEFSSPLFQAIVIRRQVLLASDPSHELTLGGQGIIAAPLIHAGTGAVFGMLKIEQIGLLGISPSSVQDFRTLCEWIGSSYARAQGIEILKATHHTDPMQQLLPGSVYDSQRSGLTELAREAGFDACAIYASFEPDPGGAVPDEVLVAQSVLLAAGEILYPTNHRYNFGKAPWTYAVLLQGCGPQKADDVVQRFSRHVCDTLAQKGYAVRSRYLVEILHQSQCEGREQPEALGDAHRQV
ncbi:GAF domain-containing protein [Microvirga calopogonii]|uniref:GAF domain-containing protein n=1 Tax=Microvirga calopogonii TaxID=2078013 RepID=UPI000E0D9CE0|nr:GAF domain-containing protein [Microvirga calopogonii]